MLRYADAIVKRGVDKLIDAIAHNPEPQTKNAEIPQPQKSKSNDTDCAPQATGSTMNCGLTEQAFTLMDELYDMRYNVFDRTPEVPCTFLVRQFHVVAQALELYRHAHQVELVQTSHIGFEGFGCTWFKVGMNERVVGARGTLSHKVVKLLEAIALHVQHVLEYVFVQTVKTALVAHLLVYVGRLTIALPIFVPIGGHRHADKHHPTQ